MKHDDGIKVSLSRSDGANLVEFENGERKQDLNFNGQFDSSIITGEAGQKFTVRVDFDDAFKFHGPASEDCGVMIVIACGHAQQALGSRGDVQMFFDNAPRRDYFSAFDTWPTETSDPVEVDLKLPEPEGKSATLTFTGRLQLTFSAIETATDADTAWQRSFNANKGCVAVFVVRGYLYHPRTKTLDLAHFCAQDRAVTEPPPSYWSVAISLRCRVHVNFLQDTRVR